jgi:hypothetical protein
MIKNLGNTAFRNHFSMIECERFLLVKNCEVCCQAVPQSHNQHQPSDIDATIATEEEKRKLI